MSDLQSLGKRVARGAVLGGNAVATGALFGLLQWCSLLTLESYVASTATIDLLATSAWLVGTVAGLKIPGWRREPVWLAAMVAAYYGLRALALRHPYETAYLPVLLAGVGAMGCYAGRFFRYRARAFGAAKRLFFLENCGFAAGVVATVPAFYWAGDAVLAWAPLGLAAFVLATVGLLRADP
jgi:hypothetical protein